MTIIIIVALFAIAIIVAFSINSKKKSSEVQIIDKNEAFYSNLINSLGEPTKTALSKLKDIYDENKALSWGEIAQQIGLPSHLIDSKDIKAVNNYLKLNDNETAKDFFQSYMLDITKRHRLQNSPLQKYNKNDALANFKVNINQNEELYEVVRSVEWFEEKVVRKDVNYNGYRWTAGGFNSGKLSYSVDVIKAFQLQDIGKIYLTTRRIIFIGNHKNVNRSIPYNSILSFKLYQDGILLGLANGKLPLIKFSQHDNTNVNDPNDAFLTNDGMNQFVSVISRILTNTQDAVIADLSK
jgi:hypothetical protein